MQTPAQRIEFLLEPRIVQIEQSRQSEEAEVVGVRFYRLNPAALAANVTVSSRSTVKTSLSGCHLHRSTSESKELRIKRAQNQKSSESKELRIKRAQNQKRWSSTPAPNHLRSVDPYRAASDRKRFAAAAASGGIGIDEREPSLHQSLVLPIDRGAAQVEEALHVDEHLHAVRLKYLVAGALFGVDCEVVAQSG